MPKLDDIVDVLANRAYVYTFLKNGFYIEPTSEYIEMLKVNDHLEDFPFMMENVYIENGVNKLKRSLKKISAENIEFLDDLRSDYTRMFIGPNDLPAPPWESSYLNEDKLLFQEETLQVRKSYLKYKYLNKNYPHEADDHIALELDFMARLSLKTIELEEARDILDVVEILRDQQLFLENHLIKWVPEFTDNIEQSAKTDYFVALAYILKGFIDYDFKNIAGLIEELKNINEMEG